MPTVENFEKDAFVNLSIDGLSVTVPKGATILEAAKATGVIIPTLCDYSGLKPRAVCRLCVVEVDGGGRLKAACATEATQGAQVVTNNRELMSIRRNVIELLLADHPKDCLLCTRNLDCELQTWAFRLGVRSLPFGEGEASLKSQLEDTNLSQNMSKCIKCGRCVAACQDVQETMALCAANRSIHYEISSPYGKTIAEGPCVFCGECLTACPVSALEEKDGALSLMPSLDKEDIKTAAIFSPQVIVGLEDALDYGAGGISSGKMVSALKNLGFDRVYPRDFFRSMAALLEAKELCENLSKEKKVACVSTCSPYVRAYAAKYYPEAIPFFSSSPNPMELFSMNGRKKGGIFFEEAETVSFMPCLAQGAEREEAVGIGSQHSYHLTVRDLVKLFKQKNFNIGSFGYSPFDCPRIFSKNGSMVKEEAMVSEEQLELARAICELKKVGESGRGYSRSVPGNGLLEVNLELSSGKSVSFHLVFGMGQAKTSLEEIVKGNLKADYLLIMACPQGCLEGGGQALKTIHNPHLTREVPNISNMITKSKLPLEKEVLGAYGEVYGQVMSLK
ncbi:MAG: (2Fe-2S)-binding protein [Deltaproteobacteria bacterium]|jgi:NADH-quinone oxidoreductase subunit G/NADP-reducing hydrogenase subunit HndD|nr:(2Fe-2S)-binding protein [Deltaproteobacteria bacterium]